MLKKTKLFYLLFTTFTSYSSFSTPMLSQELWTQIFEHIQKTNPSKGVLFEPLGEKDIIYKAQREVLSKQANHYFNYLRDEHFKFKHHPPDLYFLNGIYPKKETATTSHVQLMDIDLLIPIHQATITWTVLKLFLILKDEPLYDKEKYLSLEKRLKKYKSFLNEIFNKIKKIEHEKQDFFSKILYDFIMYIKKSSLPGSIDSIEKSQTETIKDIVQRIEVYLRKDILKLNKKNTFYKAFAKDLLSFIYAADFLRDNKNNLEETYCQEAETHLKLQNPAYFKHQTMFCRQYINAKTYSITQKGSSTLSQILKLSQKDNFFLMHNPKLKINSTSNKSWEAEMNVFLSSFEKNALSYTLEEKEDPALTLYDKLSIYLELVHPLDFIKNDWTLYQKLLTEIQNILPKKEDFTLKIKAIANKMFSKIEEILQNDLLESHLLLDCIDENLEKINSLLKKLEHKSAYLLKLWEKIALSIKEPIPSIYYNLGIAYLKNENIEKAEFYFQQGALLIQEDAPCEDDEKPKLAEYWCHIAENAFESISVEKYLWYMQKAQMAEKDNAYYKEKIQCTHYLNPRS